VELADHLLFSILLGGAAEGGDAAPWAGLGSPLCMETPLRAPALELSSAVEYPMVAWVRNPD
jgi:hypothetical protein